MAKYFRWLKSYEKTYCFLYTSQCLVDADSLLVLGYSLAPRSTDVGTLGSMIDHVQEVAGGALKRISADAGYSSLLDLQACEERNIDLLAPVQSNSFTAGKKQAASDERITKEQFTWLPDEQTFACPKGHRLELEFKEKKKRHAGRFVISYRIRCPPKFCTACPLKEMCAKNPHTGRTVKRLEGQELIDAQAVKMERDDVKDVYKKRGQIIERAFADAKRHRNFGRFHGGGESRARAETGLLVMARNLLNLERLRGSQTQDHTAT